MVDVNSRPQFADPADSEPRLQRLLENQTGDQQQNLVNALKETANPDAALVRLERYLESSRSPAIDFDLIGAAPRYAQMLLTVLDQSYYLTDIVCRNPEYMLWLWEEAELRNAPAREELVTQLLAQVRAFDSMDARWKSLRRFKRREFLRIAVRDIFAHAPLQSVTLDLSNLADACLEAATETAIAALENRYGKPLASHNGDPATFVVLALGKLGGRELNFSSDIDLIFLYSEEGETTGGTSRPVSNVEFFSKTGESVIKMLSELTAEGDVFRVDMRLRPHGRMAPLAVSLDAAVRYYETQGQAWERQAMIKCRAAAGNLALGDAFAERVRPFVYPRYFDDDTLEEIRGVKQQMERQVQSRGETEIEVKLGRGGIRDIEFTVQILQMLNGGAIPALRSASTLEALKALSEQARLSPFQADTLASNYIFLRRVEHRLQIEGSQQRHALPVAQDALDEFARRLGYASGMSFMAEYRDRSAATRTILEQFLTTKGSGNLWVTELLSVRSEAEEGLVRLGDLGFREPAKARQELLQLSAGPEERPHTLRVRQSFAAVAPQLLQSLARTANPDAVLLRLGQIIMGQRAPGTIYDMLQYNTSLVESFVSLVANSEYLASLLIRDPALFEAVGAPGALDQPADREGLERQLQALGEAYDPEAAPYRLHTGETLRIGMRDLFMGIDVFQVGRELTVLAEVCVAHAVAAARTRVAERFGAATGGFAVLGLGKMGGCELGYGSDLDLVFVYDATAKTECGMAPSEYFAAVASAALRALKEPTRYGTLYDIDARLRPDGKKGLLVVSDARLDEYYRHDAEAWERLALMKARAVAGDAEFARNTARRAQQAAFDVALRPEDVVRVDELRERHAKIASPLDLKHAEGGIAELEFALRLLQLRRARHEPGLVRGDVAGALELLARAQALSSCEARSLLDAYTLFRRVENRIRMMHGRSGSSLPQQPEERADLAQRLGMEDDLLTVVCDLRSTVHAVYTRVLSDVAQQVEESK